MSFSEWKEVKLGEIINLNYGKGLSATKRNPGKIPVYSSAGITGWHDKALIEKNGIVVGRKGTVGTVYYSETPFYCIDTAYYLTEDDTNEDLKYLYYLLNHLPLKKLNTDSAVPGLNRDNAYSQVFRLPPIREQKSIAHILSTLDDKIEVNNQINKTLENIAQVIFKQWFVDFEFPNEDGEPYKSIGGEMVESELGMIPKGWEVKELGEIIDIHDSKRIPLSKNEREKREKIYPYYGAASLMDYVDEFIFDGIYVLLGEDGTVVNEDGSPVLQYVWGKFWVNNHAHVLSGKKGVSTNFLYILLSNLNVSGAITGAVQLKINQKNLKEMKIIMPNDMKLVSQFSDIVDKSFEKIRVKRDENKNLVSLRDALLPKLMSGEIRVLLEEEGDAS